MDIDIVDIKESTDFMTVPGKPIKMLEIRYKTDKGYSGTYSIRKDEINEKTIKDLITADAQKQHDLIGSKI